jgi:LysM repeat protein
MRPTRNRPRHTLLAVAATGAFALTAASLPLLGEHAAATDKVVVVRAGQTLSEIAMEVGLTVDELATMNGLADPDRILVGQELVIRSEEPTPPAAPADKPNPAPASVSHRVASGETLSGIALIYGTTVSAIVQANGITNPSFIRSGQVLTIPGAAPQPASRAQGSKPAPSTVTHRVAAGESLWGIAQRYGTTVSAIVQANGITNPSLIRSDQVLAIPGAGSASNGSSAPASGGSATTSAAVAAGMDPLMAATVAQRGGIGQIIASEAGRQGVPVAFAMAVAWQESGWRPGVVSWAGAIGVMQLLPATGSWVADTMLGAPVNLWDPASNVRAGVALLKHYLVRYGGDRSLALAAYYQGQAATDRHGIYPVSRPYIGSILSLERMFGG